MHIYCLYCGMENAVQARFCRSCRKLIALPGTHTTVPFAAPVHWREAEHTPPGAPIYGVARMDRPRELASPPSWPMPAPSQGQSAHASSAVNTSGGWDGPTPSLYDDGVGPPSPVAALAGQHAYPKASPAPRPFPAQPLAYQIDPATGLPFDPHFQPDPLPAVRAAGTPVPFFPRFGALLVDYCILSVLWFGAVGFAAVIDSPAFGLLASLFGPALYFIIFWAMGGRTPGYRAAGLQLVHTDGSRVGLGASIVRYVGSLISWPLFCLGYLWMLWDPQAQTWHDKMADTTVIHS